VDLLFLGTSSATPTKSRNVSGVAVIASEGGGWYLVDCGEGTQHRILHTPLSLHALKAVLITHVHGDHCYGLPGLLASAGLAGRTHPLTIIAPAGIEEWIRLTLRLTQVFLPYDLVFAATETLGTWTNEDVSIAAAPLSHRVPSYAYRFCVSLQEARLDIAQLVAHGVPKGPLWGMLRAGADVELEGRVLRSGDFVRRHVSHTGIVVAGDNDKPSLLRELCAGVQVLVHEATFTQELAQGSGRYLGHSAAGDVAAFAESIGLPYLVLTHFSARYQAGPQHSPSIKDIRAEAARYYRGGLYLAEDLARYRLSKAGVFEQVS
jgi:ribonuclease Z